MTLTPEDLPAKALRMPCEAFDPYPIQDTSETTEPRTEDPSPLSVDPLPLEDPRMPGLSTWYDDPAFDGYDYCNPDPLADEWAWENRGF